MDPITLMATVTATYNGVKKAVAMGREVHDVVRQLGKWAEAADKMYSYINKESARTPGLFESIKFDKSETQEALNLAAAKLQLQNMEKEVREMFYFGELQDLGKAGYSEFVQNRKRIREERIKVIKEQAKRRAAFIDTIFWYIVLAIVLLFAVVIAYEVYDFGVSRKLW